MNFQFSNICYRTYAMAILPLWDQGSLETQNIDTSVLTHRRPQSTFYSPLIPPHKDISCHEKHHNRWNLHQLVTDSILGQSRTGNMEEHNKMVQNLIQVFSFPHYFRQLLHSRQHSFQLLAMFYSNNLVAMF